MSNLKFLSLIVASVSTTASEPSPTPQIGATIMAQLKGVKTFALATFFTMSLSLSFGQTPDGNYLKLNEEHAAILMAASYVGLGNYCWAYGVDYRSISKEINSSLRTKSSQSISVSQIIWDRGYKAGSIGLLYSPQAAKFIDVSKSEDIVNICNSSYVEALKISNLK